MKKVYIVTHETYRSGGAFSTPEKAACWYYKDELKDSDDGNTIKLGKTVTTIEEEVARMTDTYADYPCIDELKIDDMESNFIDA